MAIKLDMSKAYDRAWNGALLKLSCEGWVLMRDEHGG